MTHILEKQISDETKGGAAGSSNHKTTSEITPLGRSAGDSKDIGAFTSAMIAGERTLARQEGRGNWKSSRFEEEKETELKKQIHTLKETEEMSNTQKSKLRDLYSEVERIKKLREIREAKIAKTSLPLHQRTESEKVDDVAIGYDPKKKISREEHIINQLLTQFGFKKKEPRTPTIYNLTKANKKMQEDMEKLEKGALRTVEQNNTINETTIMKEGAPVIKNIPADADPDERIVLTPKGSTPGSLELDKNEETGGIKQGTKTPEDDRISTTTGELAKKDLPPLDFTTEASSTNKDTVAERRETRAQEITLRQRELADKTDIASIEEKVELEKELASIEAAKKKKAEEEQSLSAYDRAVKDQLKNNKTSLATKDTEIMITPQGQNGKQGPTILEGVFTKRMPGETRPVLTKEQIDTLAKRNAEKREQILNAVAQTEKKIETRAEQKGLLDKIFAAGDRFNKIPKHYKLLFTGGLVLSGAGAAIVGSATAGGAVAMIGAGYRALAGAGLFASFTELMRRSQERATGEPITEAAAARQAILAGTLAIVMTTMLPTAMHNVLAGMNGTEVLPTATKTVFAHHSPVSNLAEQATYIETAHAGDSVWKLSEHQLKAHYGEKFTGLSHEKQMSLINAVKERIAASPESYGMHNADANKLDIGERIDFGAILNDKEFMDTQFDNTKHIVAHEQIQAATEIIAATQKEPSEWLKQFNERLAERMTAEQAQNYGNEIGKAMSAGDMQKVLEIEGKMGITHEEFLKLIEESKKLEGAPKIDIPEELLKQEIKTLQPEGKVDTSVVDTLLQNNTEEVAPTERPIITVEHKEIAIPKDPQVLAFADQQMHEKIDTLFGTKGFFGFGTEAGMDSEHWKHPKVGFGEKTVQEVMMAEPPVSYEDGSKHFGIEDPSATEKMKDYLGKIWKETRLQPKTGETVEQYLKNAEAIKMAKVMNKA